METINCMKSKFYNGGSDRMVRYGYITRQKIVKAECPEEDKIGSYIWVLGKQQHKEYIRKNHP